MYKGQLARGDRLPWNQLIKDSKANVINGQIPHGEVIGLIISLHFVEGNAFAQFGVIPGESHKEPLGVGATLNHIVHIGFHG